MQDQCSILESDPSKMSPEALQEVIRKQNEELERKKEEIARQKRLIESQSGSGRPLSFKVSKKGACSVYGLNARFPVTLYSGQWDRLIDAIPALQTFLKSNADQLASKDDPRQEAVAEEA